MVKKSSQIFNDSLYKKTIFGIVVFLKLSKNLYKPIDGSGFNTFPRLHFQRMFL